MTGRPRRQGGGSRILARCGREKGQAGPKGKEGVAGGLFSEQAFERSSRPPFGFPTKKALAIKATGKWVEVCSERSARSLVVRMRPSLAAVSKLQKEPFRFSDRGLRRGRRC